MQQERALLLDNNYIALSIVTWKKAIKLVINKKAEIICNTKKQIPTNSGLFFVPSVIRLLVSIPWRAHITNIKFNRKNIIMRDNSSCQYCGEKVGKNAITIDHIIPKSRGGESTFTNCVVSCKICNSVKSNKIPAEAGMNLLYKPKHPSFYVLHRNYLINSPIEWDIYLIGKESI